MMISCGSDWAAVIRNWSEFWRKNPERDPRISPIVPDVSVNSPANARQNCDRIGKR